MALAVPPGPVNVRAKPGKDGALQPGLAGVGAGTGHVGSDPESAAALRRWGASLRRGASFRRGADFDSWGQLVKVIDEYQILARHLQETQAQHNNSEFTEEQKKTIGKIATRLELRSAALQSTQSQEEFKLEDLKNILT